MKSSFLIEYCTNFVRRNLDGVLNVGKKSVMNQYLNEMLAETAHIAREKYRDGHHHPIIFDVIAAGNVGRPTFDRGWFSSLEEWIKGCTELAQYEVVRRLLVVARSKEFEEDSRILDFKSRRKLSYQQEKDESNDKTLSVPKSLVNPEVKEGNLDRCIKRTANMDLSTIGLANQNGAWLSKEIRGIRKKLKQISSLLDADKCEVVLSEEQKAKVARRSTLEMELSIYESAMEEVTKRIRELNIENDTNQKLLKSTEDQCREEIEAHNTTIGTQDHESCLVSNTKKIEDSNGLIPGQKDEKQFFCNLCNVKCSDKSNFILHQNGRKHRNRVAQLAEEEKKKTAASIRQQQQMELMKSAPIFTPPPKNFVKKAWGTKVSSQPNYALPPPPHPVLAQVVSTSYKTPLHDAKSPLSTAKPSSPFSNYKGEAQDSRTSSKKKMNQSMGINLSLSSNDLSEAASNFMTVLCEQKKSNNILPRRMMESQKSIEWDTSRSSAHDLPYTPDKNYETNIKAQNRDERSSISLADFLTPKRKKPTSKPDTAPWMKGPTNTTKTLSTANPKSIIQIQAEEENLKSKQDKSYGNGGGSWYIERRERAESVLEIQKHAQQDLEHRLLVEEQLKIEAQIREENDRRKAIKATKKDNRNDGCDSKRRKKKAPERKKSRKVIDTKSEAKGADTRKNNRNKASTKSTKKSPSKMFGKSP